MDRLWSPWRFAYVKDAAARKEDPSKCVLCDALSQEESVRSLVVRREPLAFLILNKYPYNSGHVMVCPTRHVRDLSDLNEDEAAALMSLAARTTDLLRDSMGAQAVNLGANLGTAAGGSLEHLHVHLVPRWPGDTNFMPVVAETKVLVEMLTDTWERLRAASEGWGSA